MLISSLGVFMCSLLFTMLICSLYDIQGVAMQFLGYFGWLPGW